jgi:hypothetical protein
MNLIFCASFPVSDAKRASQSAQNSINHNPPLKKECTPIDRECIFALLDKVPL